MAGKTNKARLDEQVDAAVAAPVAGHKRKSLISQTAKKKFVAPNARRCTSKPSAYTKRLAVEICERIARGETLREIVPDLKISINTVYQWINTDMDGFREQYYSARKQMSDSLVDDLLIDTRDIKNDEAIAKKVKASVVQWYVGKINPTQYGDTRRVELSGQINHTHTHQLTEDQKRRIAESWLMSRQEVPALEAETTGPNLPALEHEGVSTVTDASVREIPPRQQVEASKRKPRNPPGATTRGRGRPSKQKLDESSDSS